MRATLRLLVATFVTFWLLSGPAAAQAGDPGVSNERPLRYVWMVVGLAVFVTVLAMIQIFEVNRRKRR